MTNNRRRSARSASIHVCCSKVYHEAGTIMPVMGDTPVRRVLATLAFFSALLGSPGRQGGDDVDLRNCEQGSASSCDRYLDSHATGKERAIALNARGLIYSNCFKYPNLCRDKNAPFVNTLKSKGFIYRSSLSNSTQPTLRRFTTEASLTAARMILRTRLPTLPERLR